MSSYAKFPPQQFDRTRLFVYQGFEASVLDTFTQLLWHTFGSIYVAKGKIKLNRSLLLSL